MRSAPADSRAGVTLAEMLVVLLIIGLTAGVTGLSVSALRRPPQSEHTRRIRAARATAIRLGTAVVVSLDSAGSDRPAILLRFMPDGRVIGSGVDPWTGVPTAPTDAASP